MSCGPEHAKRMLAFENEQLIYTTLETVDPMDGRA
jgi:hypothetical protein